MIVTVTQEHINKGKRMEPEQCPVYYAINEAYKENNPSKELKKIDYKEARIYENGSYLYHSILPKNIGDWIYDYDMGLDVGPFSFKWGA